MKNKLKKHIRKYIAVFCSLLLIPCFLSLDAYAYSSEYHLYPLNVGMWYSDSTVDGTYNAVINKENPCTLNDNNVYEYYFSGSSARTYSACYFGHPTGNFYYPYDADKFDYFIIGDIGVNAPKSSYVNFTECLLSNVNIIELLPDGSISNVVLNSIITSSSNDNSLIFHFVAPLDHYSDLTIFEFVFNPNVVYSNRTDSSFTFTAAVMAIDKDASDEQVSSIIQAIQNQTDIIENGNNETQSAVTDFNEVFEDFNEELDKVEEFDTEILDEFNAANETYLTELNNFELSASLLNAGNWLSTSMQTVYDNSSDYKMLWLVPLLLGIPLIILFIKRGDNNE